MRTKQRFAIDDSPPYVEGDIVYCRGRPVSVIHIDTEDLIVVDYYPRGSKVDIYVFVNMNGNPQETYWHDLSDEQRFRIRMSVKQRDDYTDTPFRAYNLGGYADDRYYTLEALIED